MTRRMTIGMAVLAIAALTLSLIGPAPAATGRRLTTSLSGSEERPGPGDPNATGFAVIRINQGAGAVCYDLSWADVDGMVTMAHIHEAPAGSPGPVVVTLFSDQAFDGTDETSGCVSGLDPALLKDIRKNPTDYYVNVHSTIFGPGAVRGQLGD